jgi:uncharacterized protein (DUF305 family)
MHRHRWITALAVIMAGCTSQVPTTPTASVTSSSSTTVLVGDLNPLDLKFLVEAIGHHEKIIYLAGLAGERASDGAVKGFSTEVIAELNPRLEALRETLTTRGRTKPPADSAETTAPPETLPPGIDVFAFSELDGLTGRAFDRRFVEYLAAEFNALVNVSTIEQADGADLDAMTEAGTTAKAALIRIKQLALLRFALDIEPATTTTLPIGAVPAVPPPVDPSAVTTLPPG